MKNEYTPRIAEYQSAAALAADKFKEHVAAKRFTFASVMARAALNLASMTLAAVSVEANSDETKAVRGISTQDELDAVRFLNFYVDNLHGARELARYLELGELFAVISSTENQAGLALVTEQILARAKSISAALDADGGYDSTKFETNDAVNELALQRMLTAVHLH